MAMYNLWTNKQYYFLVRQFIFVLIECKKQAIKTCFILTSVVETVCVASATAIHGCYKSVG